MIADPFVSYRPILLDELRLTVDGVAQHHGAVIRLQVGETSESDPCLLPGLLCLFTADAIAGRHEAALPAATALSLLLTMSDVFGTISETIEGDGLIRSWGMPRTLNAGDACFALAQETLLNAHGLDAERHLKAISLLDDAARAVSELMHERATQKGSAGRPAIISAAMALGALSVGIDQSTIDHLGNQLTGGANGLGPDITDRLKQAAAYVAEAGG